MLVLISSSAVTALLVWPVAANHLLQSSGRCKRCSLAIHIRIIPDILNHGGEAELGVEWGNKTRGYDVVECVREGFEELWMHVPTANVSDTVLICARKAINVGTRVKFIGHLRRIGPVEFKEVDDLPPKLVRSCHVVAEDSSLSQAGPVRAFVNELQNTHTRQISYQGSMSIASSCLKRA